MYNIAKYHDLRRNKRPLKIKTLKSVVPGVGLEPTHFAVGDFESPASTNFATRA